MGANVPHDFDPRVFFCRECGASVVEVREGVAADCPSNGGTVATYLTRSHRAYMLFTPLCNEVLERLGFGEG